MEDFKKEMRTETLLYDNNAIWFTDIGDNKLYKYDLAQRKTTLFFVFEDEREGQNRLFGSLTKKDNLIFCIPFSANALYIIDVLTKEVKKKIIKSPREYGYEDYIPISKFSSYAWYENSLFLVGASFPAIIKYDYLTDTMVYITEWFQKLKNKFAGNRDLVFKKICTSNNSIFAPCCRCNCILEFNMKSLEYKIHDLCTDVTGFNAICKNKDKFWLSPRIDEKLICWDYNNQKIEEFVFLKNEECRMNFYNDLIEVDEDHILILAGSASDTLLLNTQKNTAKILNKNLHNFGYCHYVGHKQNTFLLICGWFGSLILINENVYFRNVYLPEYYNLLEKRGISIIRVEDYLDLTKDFIEEIIDADNIESCSIHTDLYGKDIWNYVKK